MTTVGLMVSTETLKDAVEVQPLAGLVTVVVYIPPEFTAITAVPLPPVMDPPLHWYVLFCTLDVTETVVLALVQFSIPPVIASEGGVTFAE